MVEGDDSVSLEVQVPDPTDIYYPFKPIGRYICKRTSNYHKRLLYLHFYIEFKQINISLLYVCEYIALLGTFLLVIMNAR